MNIKDDILWRVYLSFILSALAGVAILVQGFRIQVVEGEHYRNLADSLTTAFRSIPAERGNIFSYDGSLLATSLPYFEVRMDVNSTGMSDEVFYRDLDSLAMSLSGIFPERSSRGWRNYLENARRSGNRYLLIRRNITYPELQQLETFPIFREGRFRGGFIAIQNNKRQSPFGILAHRTIGYVRTGPGAQSVGIEDAFDHVLSGVQGKRLMQKISGGSWMPINDRNEIEPRNGSDLVTTIDINIQDVAENALLKALQRHNASHGSVIVMEVSTGKIKAIANLGRMRDGSYWERYNYAIGERTEPGSTFKLATILALLEDNLIHPEDSVDIGKGQVRYYDRIMRDAEKHDHGRVTVQKVFEISSNVGISQLAVQHYGQDPNRLLGHFRDFGLNNRTEIEIRGEPAPVINSPGSTGWSAVSIPWISVGYEAQFTPLQMLTFYNAIANNGRMMKPYMVSEIREYGRTIKKFLPVILNEQIAGGDAIEKARQMLVGVVENGTARNIRNRSYSIAGKTGTSQIAENNMGYGRMYQASFAGFFPAEDPQYSCIVIINSPSEGLFYGSQVAGPVFKEVADKIYANNLTMHQQVNSGNSLLTSQPYFIKSSGYDLLNIMKLIGLPYSIPTDSEWVKVEMRDTLIRSMELDISLNTVPDVRGMGLKDALFLLENAGLKVQVQGRGKVQRQSISPGTPIRERETIQLRLE